MKLTSKEAKELLEIERKSATDDRWINHCLCVGDSAGIIAKALKEKFGTPYVIGTPYKGYEQRICEALEKKTPMPALEDRKGWEKNTAIEDWKSQIVTLIGEPVTTTSLAALIEKEYHYKTKVLCPLEETDGLIGSQDLKVCGEEEMEEALKDAQIVVADPLYRPICPAECEFYERAHIAFSGRMFLKNE